MIYFLHNMKETKSPQKKDISIMVEKAAMILQRKSDQIMTINKVAEYLGISVGAVRKRCQRHQLPFHRNANRLYFSRLEIENVILEREPLTIKN